MPESRSVVVPAVRLSGWLTRFENRHGTLTARSDRGTVSVAAADGATAEIAVPFPPLGAGTDPLTALVVHVGRDRRVGVLLVRRGGHAVGIFSGRTLTTSKVGSDYVQGRTKAGGWSQQRYARRRANQTRHAYAEAADATAAVLLTHLEALDAVVTGGDRTGLAEVLADPRLSGLAPLLQSRVLDVGDPRRRVLEATPEQFTSVTIALNELA